MRMYQRENQRYHIRAPWENKDLRPIKPIVKTFQKPEYLVRNQDLSAREVRTVLPPVGRSGEFSMEQTNLLKQRTGVLLYSSRPNVINRIKRALHAADPLNQSMVANTQLIKILMENNMSIDDNTAKMLLHKFDPGQSGKCDYDDVLAFLSDTLDEYKIQRDRSEFVNLPRQTHKSKVRHPSMNSSEFILAPLSHREAPEDDYAVMPGIQSRMKLNQAFVDRRDAGLRLEIERCFQEYKGRGDIYFVFANLKKILLSREEDIIGQYKLKGVVTHHQLPLNDALIDKLIDRLDPGGSGNVSCQIFMEFLEKSLPLPKGHTGFAANGNKPSFNAPVRPKWETREPLKAIQSNSNAALRNGTSKAPQEAPGKIGLKEFDRLMKLVTALRRRSGDSDTLRVGDAREIILKYNALFALGLSQSTVDAALRKHERSGFVEVDNIIDELGILEGM